MDYKTNWSAKGSVKACKALIASLPDYPTQELDWDDGSDMIIGNFCYEKCITTGYFDKREHHFDLPSGHWEALAYIKQGMIVGHVYVIDNELLFRYSHSDSYYHYSSYCLDIKSHGMGGDLLVTKEILRELASPSQIVHLEACEKAGKYVDPPKEEEDDQEAVCEYCKDNIWDGYVNTGPHNLCEGSKCDEARQMYNEDNPKEPEEDTTPQFNKGDLVVVTKAFGRTSNMSDWFEDGEILELDGEFWGGDGFNAISKKDPDGNGFNTEDIEYRHATPEEIEHFKNVGRGANIKDVPKTNSEDIDKAPNEKRVVHVPTQEMWDFVSKHLGWEWKTGNWDNCKDDSCIDISRPKYDAIKHLKEYYIISFEDFCKSRNIWGEWLDSQQIAFLNESVGMEGGVDAFGLYASPIEMSKLSSLQIEEARKQLEDIHGGGTSPVKCKSSKGFLHWIGDIPNHEYDVKKIEGSSLPLPIPSVYMGDDVKLVSNPTPSGEDIKFKNITNNLDNPNNSITFEENIKLIKPKEVKLLNFEEHGEI